MELGPRSAKPAPRRAARREPWSTKRDRTRLELVAAALDLVRRQGFDATTVDEIVERAGTSRTTFFRYFAGKDDAVLHHLDASGSALLQEAGRALVGGPVWPALQSACVASTRYLLLRPNTMRALLGVIDDHPALRAGRLARTDAVRCELTTLIARGDDDAPSDLAARCALAIVDSANESWRTDADVDLVRTIIAGFDRLAPSFA